MSPVISILVPVYNAERFLRPFLDSLARQNLTNAEVVFVDDCSTDGSLEILRHYELPRMRIVSLAKNGGVSEARQAALENSHGDFVIFADPDDTVDAGMYAELVEVAEKTDADLVWEDFFENDVRRSCRLDDLSADAVLRAILSAKLHGATWNKLIRRKFIEKAQARFPRGRVGLCEDVDFLCQVLAANPVCAYHSGCHYRYVNVPTSATHALTTASFDSLRIVHADLMRCLQTPPQRAALDVWWKGNCLSCFMQRSISSLYFSCFAEGVGNLAGLNVSVAWKILYWFGCRGFRPLILKLKGVS